MNSRNIAAPYFKPAKAFYLSASLCFVLLAVLLLFSQEAFSGHYFQPKLLALTHLAALGWGTLIIFGVCCNALPDIFETDTFNPKPLWTALAFFLSGLGFLIYSFWKFLPGFPMQLGSLLLLTGILIFAVMVFAAAKKSRENNIRQEYITTAFVWLTLTALLGVLMVFNFRYAFLPKDHLDFLRIHAHAGIAGWFLMLMIGLSAGSYLPDQVNADKLLSITYYTVNIALLLFLVDGYLSGINLKTYALLLTGFIGLGAYLLFIFKSSRQKKRDFFSIVYPILLLLAAALIPFIIHYSLKNEPSAVRLSMLYGTLIFMGWITAFAFSYTFSSCMSTWNTKYKALFSVVFVLFCITFFPGLLFENKTLQVFGLACLLAVSCFYFAGTLSVVKKQVQNRAEEAGK